MDKHTFTVSDELAGTRLDKFLSVQDVGLTRSAIQKLIDEGAVLVCGKKVSKNYKVRQNDLLEIEIADPIKLDVLPQNIPISIVYEDDSLLVVNKPKGLVVHPAAGNPDGTLVNALLYHCGDRLSSINGVIRPGIVHRIDKLTSGLLMVAKTDKAHNCLAQQIKEHSFTREYQAVLLGRLSEKTGCINQPIGRSKFDRKRMCVTQLNSKNAVTHYEVLEEMSNYSLVKFRLETGRTHQIRVHSAFIGHPVLGDSVYGKPFKGLDGQCLHAKKIGFVHPDSGAYMEFDSELPPYFVSTLNKIKRG